jgi:CheY-like chemotaxis protein
MAQPRLNLKSVVALLVDRDPFSRGLVSQMLRGFGISTILIADTGAEAKEILGQHRPDVCFIEGALPDMAAADLLGWIRRHANRALRFAPVIVLSGYTQMRLISAARDGGANLVVRKPVSPQVLFDRLGWVAATERAFVEAPNYVGPDRRFHAVDPPDGRLKRENDQPVPIEVRQ